MSSGSIILRVRSTAQANIQDINFLTPNSTFESLHQVLSSVTEIPEDELKVLSGFPPKVLHGERDSELKDVGIRHGDLLIVEKRSATDPPQYSALVAPVVSKPLPLREVNIAAPPAVPPSPAVPPVSAVPLSPAVNSAENSTKTTSNSPKAIKAESSTPGVFLSTGSALGPLLKREVPSDNSCLFASMDYVLNGKICPQRSQQLRQLVSKEVELQTDLIPDYVLDKPRSQYSAWIQRPQSWGGEVELALLSNYYSIEIVAVDARSGRVNRFGESEKFAVRVFLLYDGIHYDPLHMESPNAEGYFYTSFASSEDGVLAQAVDLAGQAFSSGSFTDTEKFTLQCGNCGKRLRGQVEAQQHARATAHTDFQEVKDS